MKKTGIMGGSFNPIHVGHLEIAECAWKEYGLDEILFIPNYCPPHKDSSEMLDAKSRLDMVKLAIQGHPNYTVTDREIQKGGLSYTYLTINELKAEEPDTEFYFLMGADSLADFRKWSHAEVIASKCHILAAMRDELGDEDVKQIADELSLEYQGDFSLLKIHNPLLHLFLDIPDLLFFHRLLVVAHNYLCFLLVFFPCMSMDF